MNFAFSDEQEELRASVRRVLSEKSPESEVRRLMDTTEGYDPAVWGQMADQLGLQSLTIPEEFGGSGFTYVELLVVLEEMGAALLCAPFFSSVALAANALLTSGDDEAKKSFLPGIASPVRRHRRMYTLLSIGPTTIWWTSAAASLQTFSSCPMVPAWHSPGASGRKGSGSGRHPGEPRDTPPAGLAGGRRRGAQA